MSADVSRETKLADYVELLTRWGRRISLTSKRDAAEPQLREHIADSLALVPHLPANLDRLIDLGSGQGFPAIPIAIATGIPIEMIEADRRKAAFLTTALAELQLKGTVWATRIEATRLPPARCVTARALADLAVLIEWARPLTTVGGCCLFLKGPAAPAELSAVRAKRDITAQILPTGNPRSYLVRVSDLG